MGYKSIKWAAQTFLVVALILFARNLPAQDAGRKLVSNPAPAYPSTARNFHLSGVVRVQVVIAPDGHIKRTQVLGGHPLLVDAVQETLKSWKYEPAGAESTANLEFNFHP